MSEIILHKKAREYFEIPLKWSTRDTLKEPIRRHISKEINNLNKKKQDITY